MTYTGDISYYIHEVENAYTFFIARFKSTLPNLVKLLWKQFASIIYAMQNTVHESKHYEIIDRRTISKTVLNENHPPFWSWLIKNIQSVKIRTYVHISATLVRYIIISMTLKVASTNIPKLPVKLEILIVSGTQWVIGPVLRKHVYD